MFESLLTLFLATAVIVLFYVTFKAIVKTRVPRFDLTVEKREGESEPKGLLLKKKL